MTVTWAALGINVVDLLSGSIMHGFRRYSQDYATMPPDAPHREILEYPEDRAGTVWMRLVCYERRISGEAYTVKAEITIAQDDRDTAETFIRAWLVG